MDLILLRSGLKLSLCVSESAVPISCSLPDHRKSRIAKTMHCLTIVIKKTCKSPFTQSQDKKADDSM